MQCHPELTRSVILNLFQDLYNQDLYKMLNQVQHDTYAFSMTHTAFSMTHTAFSMTDTHSA
jgi:hypothetical protein